MTRDSRIAIKAIIMNMQMMEELREHITRDLDSSKFRELSIPCPGEQTAKNIGVIMKVANALGKMDIETNIELLQELLDDNAPHREV